MRVLIAGLVAGLVAFQPAAAQDGPRMPITLDPQTGEVVSVVDASTPFTSQDGPTLLAADMAPNSPLVRTT